MISLHYLNDSTKIFYRSKNKKNKLQIVYGSFKFKKTEDTVEEYKDEVYSFPHMRKRIDLQPKTKINFLELVNYDAIKLLSRKELKKIKVKKKPCK